MSNHKDYVYEVDFDENVSRAMLEKIAAFLRSITENKMEAIHNIEVSVKDDSSISFTADVYVSALRYTLGCPEERNGFYGGHPAEDGNIDYGINTVDEFREYVKEACEKAGYSYDAIEGEDYSFPEESDIFDCIADYNEGLAADYGDMAYDQMVEERL